MVLYVITKYVLHCRRDNIADSAQLRVTAKDAGAAYS